MHIAAQHLYRKGKKEHTYCEWDKSLMIVGSRAGIVSRLTSFRTAVRAMQFSMKLLLSMSYTHRHTTNTP